MHPKPPGIRDAINAFEPPNGFIILPPRRNEMSVIFAFGVRLVKSPENPSAKPNPSSPVIWISRVRLVNNNLPYRLGEYEEYITIRELVFKDATQATIYSKIILSLLQPITQVSIKSQGESANQVEVLLTLYKLRTTVLDCFKELQDYRSSKTHRMTFRPEDLTALATSTRTLLHDAFHKRFFSLYTNQNDLLCNTNENGAVTAAGERHFAKIEKIIYDKARAVMLSVVITLDVRVAASQVPAPHPTLFSEDMMDDFGDRMTDTHVELAPPANINNSRVVKR
ncbi:hypothetical protein GN958_ATG21989 [Phytophthora infestans]|uniref:Uncharacterized protein n=1 Tax=Phytophthora infestans TaxID=4787 RepID=A0A8S9TQ13_PHYIN|nr:hypothetical protein GN958_ATG21989 [Phytophthora infestans]